MIAKIKYPVDQGKPATRNFETGNLIVYNAWIRISEMT